MKKMQILFLILAMRASILFASHITEADFKSIGPQIEIILLPLVEQLSDYENFQVHMKWDDLTRDGGGAGGRGMGKNLTLYANRFLAQQSAVTSDCIIFALCHELGHMIADYPRIANELNADIFAVQTCMPLVWKAVPGVSDATEIHAEAIDLPTSVVTGCEKLGEPDGQICKRMIRAALSGNLYRFDYINGPPPIKPSLERRAPDGKYENILQCELDMAVDLSQHLPRPSCMADRRL